MGRRCGAGLAGLLLVGAAGVAAGCGGDEAGWCDDGNDDAGCPAEVRVDSRVYAVACSPAVLGADARGDELDAVHHDGEEHEVTAWTTRGLVPASDVLLLDGSGPAGEGCAGTAFAYGADVSGSDALAALDSLAAPPSG